MNNKKQPEILYNEDEQNFPFIKLEKDEEMPAMLVIASLKDTGETEEENGNEMPVFDWEPTQYFSADFMKKKLDTETYDKIRFALGLEPLKSAQEKGNKIAEKVRENLETAKNLKQSDKKDLN